MPRLKGYLTVYNSYVFNANGYACVIHVNPQGYWYGIIKQGPIDPFFAGSSPSNEWPLKKARRKALKNLFRLPKLN